MCEEESRRAEATFHDLPRPASTRKLRRFEARTSYRERAMEHWAKPDLSEENDSIVPSLEAFWEIRHDLRTPTE